GEGVAPGGPELAGLYLDAGSAQVLVGAVEQLRRHVGREPRAGAPVAASAWLGVRVVELLTQELEAASLGADVRAHSVSLGRTRPGDASVALRVVAPLAAGRLPAALDPPARPGDVEPLEQQL